MHFYVKSFLCGCCSLETGVKVMGVIHAICSFISVIWNIVIMHTLEKVEGQPEEVYQFEKLIDGLGIPIDLVGIAVNILLVVGVAKQSVTMMLPAMVWTVCEIISYIIGFFMLSVALMLMGQLNLTFTIFMGLIPLIGIWKTYFFVVVKSLYSDFKGLSDNNIRHTRLV